MKNILLAVCVAVFCSTVLCSGQSAAATSIKPNILFILTDDQGWPTLGAYGGDIVPTPNLDRLAREGVKFTKAYVTPICTPTRATLLSGQYTARNGMFKVIINPWYGSPWARMEELPNVDHYPRDGFSIAKGLQSAGYKTGVMGKWHLTYGRDGAYLGLEPEYAQLYGFDYAPPVMPREEFEPGHDRGVAMFTDQAIGFIERNQDDPWFCFVSHHMIHSTVVAPDEMAQEYRDRGYGDIGPNRAIYLAGLETIDRSVGRLLDTLDRLGETDETMVVFLTDNGGVDERHEHRSMQTPHPATPKFGYDLQEYSNAPLRDGKGSNYEGGIRVPLIVRWPGQIEANSVIDTPVHAIDIAPTFLEIADAEFPEDHHFDGHSLRELMTTGRDESLDDRPLYQYYPAYDWNWGLTPSASIIRDGYKLIEFFGDRVDSNRQYIVGHHIELYNLDEDLGETRDLAMSDPDKAASLMGQLHDWMNELGVEPSGRNAHHDPDRAFTTTTTRPDWMD
jgi:uncharacterized sulfatase